MADTVWLRDNKILLDSAGKVKLSPDDTAGSGQDCCCGDVGCMELPCNGCPPSSMPSAAIVTVDINWITRVCGSPTSSDCSSCCCHVGDDCAANLNGVVILEPTSPGECTYVGTLGTPCSCPSCAAWRTACCKPTSQTTCRSSITFPITFTVTIQCQPGFGDSVVLQIAEAAGCPVDPGDPSTCHPNQNSVNNYHGQYVIESTLPADTSCPDQCSSCFPPDSPYIFTMPSAPACGGGENSKVECYIDGGTIEVEFV